jgi:ABC-type antimicrobial peptide transport system permease subunit
MFFIFKHSIKSVFRTPFKSILYMLLLSAAILFVSIGSSMLYSANRMLDQANNQFNTIVSLKYGGLHNTQGAWADETFQNAIEQMDFTKMTDHSAVLAVDTEREIYAFADDTDEINQQTSPFSNFSVFTFRPLYMEEGYGWIGVSQDILFGDSIDEEILVQISPLSSDGTYITGELEEGRTYLGAAIIEYARSRRAATFVDPANLTSYNQDEMTTLAEITDITDLPDYFETPEGQLWQTLIDSLAVIDQSFSVTVSSYLPGTAAFHLNQTWLTDGQFETDDTYQATDSDVCYISDRVAALLGLEVGDEWHLRFHYNPSGDPSHSYWDEDGFIYKSDIRIAGIFKEAQGLAFKVYIPDQEWMDKDPDGYDFLRVLVKNDEVDSYLAYLTTVLPDIVGVQVEDQGYSLAVEPILTLREYAVNLTLVSVVAGIAVTILFSYLFIVRQRETARYMMMMGTGRRRTGAYLLFGILIIAFFASIVGALLAGMIDLRITEAVWNALQQEPALDVRYSERALGIPSEFTPDLITAPWIRWTSAGLIVVIIILITLGFALLTLRRPRRKKIKEISGPALRAGKGVSFMHVPFISLRFAFRSVRRNLLRSMIVPVTAFFLAVFILSIGYVSYQQQIDAETVYDEVPATAYLTTFLGESREIPLHLQSDIFNLLDSEYQSRSTREMLMYGMNGDKLTELKRSLEENNPYIEQVLLTHEMHYALMGVVASADGQMQNPDLPRRPQIEIHSSSYGYDWFRVKVNQMPVLLFTDSLTASPEFSKTRTLDVDWLNGYSDTSLGSSDFIAVLPDRLLEENDIHLGDMVRIACYKNVEDVGVLMEAYDFLVVGSYNQGSRSPVIYSPWSLVCYMKITYDLNFLSLESPEADIPEGWQYPNEYLADFIHTATIVPADTRDLSSLRDYLGDRDYSQVGKINRNRLAIVIEDKALTDAVESIQQHIYFINLIKPIMLVLSSIIGFLLSYLLTRNRLREFAIMRSLGTKRFDVYSAFFLEQLMLFLLGLIPILAVLCVRSEWIHIFGLNLLWFILLYTLGIMTAIHLMGRFVVLDILFSKD